MEEIDEKYNELENERSNINDNIKANKDVILQLKEDDDNRYYEIDNFILLLKESYKNIESFYNFLRSRDEYNKLLISYEELLKNKENDYSSEIDYALTDGRIFNEEKSLLILNINKMEYENGILLSPYKLKSDIRRKAEDLKSDVIDNIFNSLSNDIEIITKVKKKYGIKNIADVFNKIISDTFKEFRETTPYEFRRKIDNDMIKMEGVILNIIGSCLRLSLIDQAMSDSILRLDRGSDKILVKILKDISSNKNELDKIEKEIKRKQINLDDLDAREKEYTKKASLLEEKIENRKEELKDLENVTITKNIINENLNSDDKPVFNNSEDEKDEEGDEE